MVLQNQRLASLSQRLSFAEMLVGSAAAVFTLVLTFFPIQDKYMLILGGAMCGCVATWLCSYHAANIDFHKTEMALSPDCAKVEFAV